jgi:hypothetical protein
MEVGVDRPICDSREPGAGAPACGGHDSKDRLAPVKGIVFGLFVSFWVWWVTWLCIRAYSAAG